MTVTIFAFFRWSLYGAASNLDDLLYLRGIDVVMTQSDVFEYFRTQRKTPNLEKRIHYIIRLPVSELHVLARSDIKSIEDLRGKKVNFGPAGSASSLTGTIVFQRLGVQVEQVMIDNPTALQKLKSGEIAALLRVIGKPIDFFAHIPANSGLHFVPIPFSKTFADFYGLGELSHQEYPNLVREGEPVDTIAVPAVLAVFNWPKGHDHFRRVERFVEHLFTKWDKFREPPRHSTMARRQSCRHRSRLDPLGRRGRDAKTYEAKGCARSESRHWRLFVLRRE